MGIWQRKKCTYKQIKSTPHAFITKGIKNRWEIAVVIRGVNHNKTSYQQVTDDFLITAWHVVDHGCHANACTVIWGVLHAVVVCALEGNNVLIYKNNISLRKTHRAYTSNNPDIIKSRSRCALYSNIIKSSLTITSTWSRDFIFIHNCSKHYKCLKLVQRAWTMTSFIKFNALCPSSSSVNVRAGKHPCLSGAFFRNDKNPPIMLKSFRENFWSLCVLGFCWKKIKSNDQTVSFLLFLLSSHFIAGELFNEMIFFHYCLCIDQPWAPKLLLPYFS